MPEILQYEDKTIGSLVIDVKNLEVHNKINWEKLWKMCCAEPLEFADRICEMFDRFYSEYGVEHDFEPELYAEELGNTEITLKKSHTEYLVWLNLDRPSNIEERPRLF